ncbi:MAG: serine/threonine protein kinase [Lentisphaeraceae bacterium]|nr:serine/threonine protein kinase [Lentisphaeraceae bacterium]
MSDETNDSDFQVPDFCLNVDERLSEFFYDLQDQSEQVEKGTIRERYEIKSKIAEGGVKEIFCGFDTSTQRFVAIAYLKKNDQEFIDHFLREAHLTALLEHPNIIPIYDVVEDQKPFFTMKILQGQNFGEILFEENRQRPINQLLRMFVDVCSAIEYAHSRGVVHLDLKPENIQVDKQDEVLVLDWGLSQRLYIPENDKNLLAIDKVESSRVIKGTPSYMAPEQFSPDKKVVDERTDVFSLGCILFSLLTKNAPFESSINFSKRKLNISKLDLPISESLRAVTLKALETNPESRYESVKKFKEEINLYLDGFPTEAEAASFTKQLTLLFKRNKLIVFSLSVMALLLIMTTTAFISKLEVSKNKVTEALQKSKEDQLKTEDALVKAKENFLLYINEKEERFSEKRLTSTALNRTEITPNNSNYEIALDQLDSALKVSPYNQRVYDRKVLLHIFYEEFEKAIEAYGFSSKKGFLVRAVEIVEKYRGLWQNGRLSDSSFLSFIREMQVSHNKWIAGNMVLVRKGHISGRLDHLSFIKSLLTIMNPEQKEWIWDFDTDDGVIFSHFSLSGLSKVHTFIGLAGCKISFLDLSGLEEVYLGELVYSYVNTISFLDTKIHHLHELKRIDGLKKIIVRRGQLSAEDLELLKSYEVVLVD